MERAKLGAKGEAIAAQYYLRQGYSLYAHNFRCRMGELDLVLTRGHLLVVAEVKTRTDCQRARPREAVDLHKQKKLILACRYLLTQLPPADWIIRFDVVEVCPRPAGGYEVHCIQDAFRAGEL